VFTGLGLVFLRDVSVHVNVACSFQQTYLSRAFNKFIEVNMRYVCYAYILVVGGRGQRDKGMGLLIAIGRKYDLAYQK
jgi:hypothetical protein